MVMEFKCKSIMKPTVVWQKGDEIIAESDRLKMSFNQDEGSDVFQCAMEIKVRT